ncbi:MAG TPA: hypothetical protein VGE86_08690 [Thermoanaerobaculia bacterium]
MKPGPKPRPAPAPGGGVELRPGELAGLVFQSALLAGSMGFVVAILLARIEIFPRPIAFGLGLEAGLLASYPTMRLIARANGSALGFWTWAAITLLPAALGITILLVV